MEKQRRRNHTVSKFYLRGFANDAGQIRRISLPGDDEHLVSISDATVIKDFYLFEVGDGETSDAFEIRLGEAEAVAVNAYSEVSNGRWPLDGDLRAGLATWIALQHLRGERERDFVTQHAGNVYQLLVGISGKEALRQHIERHEGRAVPDVELDAEWDDLTKPGGPTLEPDPIPHLRMIDSLVPQAAAYLADCHWTLARFTRRSLLTSDHPVAMSVDEGYPSFRGVGILTADLFALALSRRIGLSIQPRRRLEEFTNYPDAVPDFEVAGSTAFANSLNQQAVSHARRYVFLHPDDEIDARIVFPSRQGDVRTYPVGDHFIQPGGLQSRPGSPSADDLGLDRKASISLDDLPWPIPRRLRSVHQRPGGSEGGSRASLSHT